MIGMNPGVVVSKIENTRPSPGGRAERLEPCLREDAKRGEVLNDRNADAEHERDREHVPERV